MDLFLLVFIPSLRNLVDFLFLFFIFLGFWLRSNRFLWLWGAGMGAIKDLMTGSLFGGFACSYAFIGWLMGGSRHFIEQEDSLAQAIWTAMLSGLHAFVYGLLIILADPQVGWNRWFWGIVPFQMIISGGCAAFGFPRVKKITV